MADNFYYKKTLKINSKGQNDKRRRVRKKESEEDRKTM